MWGRGCSFVIAGELRGAGGGLWGVEEYKGDEVNNYSPKNTFLCTRVSPVSSG